ncbi:MAG: histidine ammonia-lyase [Chitinophagaceae bacterium]
MNHHHLEIGTQILTFDSLKKSIHLPTNLDIATSAKEKINKCRNYLNIKTSSSDKAYYGINTGFGYLQHIKIDASQTQQLQYNLLMSHACGMGNKVPAEIVKLMLLLKIQSLSYGNSGVQEATVNRLKDLYNNNILPVVYTQGSLGASGDLAPLSHLCLPLIGMGKVIYNDVEVDATNVLEEFNWQPIELKSKEGLALINGTQFMSAYGIYCLAKAQRLLQWANIIAAISFDGFDATLEPLNPLIHKVRNHKGQIETAATIYSYLKDSTIATNPNKQVQDPYSFRCVPQVHGASIDTFNYVLDVFMNEVNGVTDNPNIFPDEDLIVSGGNFHGQPLALGLDFLSIAMSEIASISERRTYQLISGQRGLPLFLVNEPGLNSGFMIPQYTAASIVSQNKQLCTPASVDTISSSNNQEDHVSMGANAATKCYQIIENVERVLAIELLTAAQALDFRKPEKTSPFLENIINDYRAVVSFNQKDRLLHTDMQATVKFLNDYTLL